MKSVLAPLPKSVLVPLRLTTSTSATVPAIQKKIFGLETTPVISNEEVDNIKKSGIVIKGVSKTIKKQLKLKQNNKKLILSYFIGNISCLCVG